MIPVSRRDFLKTSASTGAWFLSLQWGIAARPEKELRFGVCADPHHDIMHDAEERLSRFTDAANNERLNFTIQLGDFCRPYEKNRGFLQIWEGFSGPRFHTLGNHDNDGGFTWQQVMNFWGMRNRYYSFDQCGWHCVVLDGNEIKPENRAPGYPRYIGPEQQDWLKADLRETAAPTLVFSHQSLEHPQGVENGQEIRGILEAANRSAGWRKVGACLSGHHHIDHATQINGIHYLQINSMSYQWLGEKRQHVRYSAEVDKKHPYIKYTAPYREALFAMVTLTPEGELQVRGRRSEFVGPSPWELGVQEVKGTSWDKSRTVPWISDRSLQMAVSGE